MSTCAEKRPESSSTAGGSRGSSRPRAAGRPDDRRCPRRSRARRRSRCCWRRRPRTARSRGHRPARRGRRGSSCRWRSRARRVARRADLRGVRDSAQIAVARPFGAIASSRLFAVPPPGIGWTARKVPPRGRRFVSTLPPRTQAATASPSASMAATLAWSISICPARRVDLAPRSVKAPPALSRTGRVDGERLDPTWPPPDAVGRHPRSSCCRPASVGLPRGRRRVSVARDLDELRRCAGHLVRTRPWRRPRRRPCRPRGPRPATFDASFREASEPA